MVAHSPEPDFTPISPNPFIVGNPVRDRSMFFGRETEFELVRSRFQQSQRGGLLVFCGERRSGKTSILFQILDRRLGADFIPVLIDMQSMAITNEADFLSKIAHEVLDALGDRAEGIPIPDFSPGSNHAATFQKFVEGVLRLCPDRKLILLFDEYELFENKIDAGILGRDVLYILHNLMENQSVFLVFTGSQHLEQRRRDYWRILGASIWKQISYLEQSDARKLICKPVEGRVTYAPGTVDAIYRLSAGQPFYTQALCQSLVDQLNERRVREVTHELLGEVVKGLVNNPLPQMIFLWDSLGRDERLALALLAEALSSDRDLASDAALVKLIRTRKYPLNVGRARIAAALEGLFRAELLSKDDSLQPPGYAFRMDLWRLWIRRMHSVWQVMRELGLDIRPPRGVHIGPVNLSPVVASSFALALVLAAAGLVIKGFRDRSPSTASQAGAPPQGAGPVGAVELDVVPSFAVIELDGRLAATGALRASLPPGTHSLRLSAPGFASESLSVRLVPHRHGPNGPLTVDGFKRQVALRALQGDLRVVTDPPGAQLRLDGSVQAVSPFTFQGVGLAGSHEIEATLPGHDPVRRTVQLEDAGKLLTITVPLRASTGELQVTSEPTGAAISVDGAPKGATTLHLTDVAYGRHRFSARLDGYTALDSSVNVAAAAGVIHLTLLREPPGELEIKGDKPAEIYVDKSLVKSGVQFCRLTVPGGPHAIMVSLASGDSVSKTLVVKSKERVVFDYSSGSVSKGPVPPGP